MMKTYYRHFPGLFLLCVVFVPPLRFLPSALSAVRGEDFLLASAILVLATGRKWQPYQRSTTDTIPGLLIALGLAGMMGMVVGVVGLGQELVVKDLILVPQVAKYLLVYLIMRRLLTSPEVVTTTQKYIPISASLAALLAIAQYWNLFGVNSWLSPLYITRQPLIAVMQNPSLSWRVSGTVGNANVYGVILVWHAAILLTSYVSVQRSMKRSLILCCVLILMLAVALTQSRSSLAFFGIVWVLALALGSNQRWRKKGSTRRSAVVLIVLMPLALWGLLHWIENSERGFGSRLAFSTESTQSSYEARVRDLVRPTLYAFETPLAIPFGRGPSKASLRTDSHNGYTWMLLRFGLVGLALYIALQVMSLRRAIGMLRQRGPDTDLIAVSSAGIVVCVWILSEFTNSTFKLPQSMALYLLSAAWLSSEASKASYRGGQPPNLRKDLRPIPPCGLGAKPVQDVR